MRRWLFLMFFGCIVLALVGAGVLFLRARSGAAVALPPTAALPTPLPTVPPTETHTPTTIPSPTATHTPSLTPTPTLTRTATPTSTLATLVLRITAINSDVTLQPAVILNATRTPTPLPTVSVPTPPARMPPAPAGDTSVVGWFEHEISDPAIQRQGKWDMFTATYRAAHRRYLYTDDEGARLTLRFLGAALRVRYVAFHAYGVFQVLVDGQVRATIDSYHPKQADGRGNFLSTSVFGLAHGWHTLEIVRMGRKAPESKGTIVAIDAIDVYRNGSAPTVQATMLPTTPTLTPSPVPAQKIQLIAAPPTVQPTSTTAPPAVIAINFNLAYDLNNNKTADPAEGVQGISLRLVRADTNQVIASGYTNAEGFVHLEATTSAPLRLVVPYFNRFWDIPPGSGSMRITMVIPPANQPGIIP